MIDLISTVSLIGIAIKQSDMAIAEVKDKGKSNID